MRFSRDSCVTDFCSCKIGIQYILYISTELVRQLSTVVSASFRLGESLDCLLLLPGMACMQALQEQKPATEKALFFEAPLIG